MFACFPRCIFPVLTFILLPHSGEEHNMSLRQHEPLDRSHYRYCYLNYRTSRRIIVDMEMLSKTTGKNGGWYAQL